MPDFHLITDPDLQPSTGIAATGDHTGFPNDVLWPDMQTFRRLPWDPASGIVLADACRRRCRHSRDAPGHPAAADRTAGAARAVAWVATELEFYAYEDSYPQSLRKGYRDLSPLYHRSGDNDVLVTEVLDLYLRPLRLAMAGLGLPAETTQSEGGAGQAEINFPASAPVAAADGHSLFKHAAKAIAHQRSCSVTFMAMPSQFQAGSGCHLHLSLRDEAGNPCTAAPGSGAADTELSDHARAFLGGLLAFSPELTLLHAPLVNSYRRLQPGGWAPSAATWGYDNRAAMVRVVGRGNSLRMELRLPGADASPYLSIAAALAAGIGGLEEGTELPAAMQPAAGAQGPGDPRPEPVPMDLTEAIQRFACSKLADRAFGEGVRDHVVCMARHQLRLPRLAVTDWELSHGFETA
jgi:glutamine synthetase